MGLPIRRGCTGDGSNVQRGHTGLVGEMHDAEQLRLVTYDGAGVFVQQGWHQLRAVRVYLLHGLMHDNMLIGYIIALVVAAATGPCAPHPCGVHYYVELQHTIRTTRSSGNPRHVTALL